MKRFALFLLSACPGVAVLLMVTGCVDATRWPYTPGYAASGVYRIEAWNERSHYYAGEKVRMRVTLTSLAREPRTWGDEKTKVPVLDIHMVSAKRADGQVEEHFWSQEHPDKVKYSVTLKTGDWYVVEWEFTPQLLEHYYAEAIFLGEHALSLDFVYGVEPPGPLP